MIINQHLKNLNSLWILCCAMLAILFTATSTSGDGGGATNPMWNENDQICSIVSVLSA